MTPEEIAQNIVKQFTVSDTWGQESLSSVRSYVGDLREAIATAIRAEQERLQKAEDEIDRLRERIEELNWLRETDQDFDMRTGRIGYDF